MNKRHFDVIYQWLQPPITSAASVAYFSIARGAFNNSGCSSTTTFLAANDTPPYEHHVPYIASISSPWQPCQSMWIIGARLWDLIDMLWWWRSIRCLSIMARGRWCLDSLVPMLWRASGSTSTNSTLMIPCLAQGPLGHVGFSQQAGVGYNETFNPVVKSVIDRP
jgi:hypothetical protein